MVNLAALCAAENHPTQSKPKEETICRINSNKKVVSFRPPSNLRKDLAREFPPLWGGAARCRSIGREMPPPCTGRELPPGKDTSWDLRLSRKCEFHHCGEEPRFVAPMTAIRRHPILATIRRQKGSQAGDQKYRKTLEKSKP